MPDREADSCEVHGTTRVRAGNDSAARRRSCTLQRGQLARTDVGRELGLQRRVRPARAATEPVVVQLEAWIDPSMNTSGSKM